MWTREYDTVHSTFHNHFHSHRCIDKAKYTVDLHNEVCVQNFETPNAEMTNKKRDRLKRH